MSDFSLHQETREGSLRLDYRAIVKKLWEGHTMAVMSPPQKRRIFRMNRPEETWTSAWSYKVWRQEVRRVCGLANGSIKKRTLDKNKVMPAMQQWCRDRGLKLNGGKDERAATTLSLEGNA